MSDFRHPLRRDSAGRALCTYPLGCDNVAVYAVRYARRDNPDMFFEEGTCESHRDSFEQTQEQVKETAIRSGFTMSPISIWLS